MDENQIDQIARGLAREAPRRMVLSGLVGGALAVLAGGSVSANNRAKRRRRRRRGGDGRDGAEDATGEVTLPPGTLAGGIWDETIQICHFDPERGEYRITSVPTVTVPEYLNAGDTLYIDCCVDTDCVGLACFTSSGCIEGACAYDATPGVSCLLGDGAYGVCNDDGVCAASAAPPPAPPTTSTAPVAQEAPPVSTEAAPLALEAAPVATGEAPLAYEAPIIATSAVPVAPSEPVG